MKKYFHVLLFIVLFIDTKAQEQFSVSIFPSVITSTPPVHSGAFAEWGGKWVFIGGRKEGLHNFQSGLAFSNSGRNDSIFVVDPVNNLRWASYAGALPVDLFESLCSTNMEFYRDSSTLYVIGGFGRKSSISSWTTFPFLTAIDLDGLSNAVMAGNSITPYFRQITDSNLAVTGGHLERIDTTYYLVFGQRFEGTYSSSGPPLFTQHYTSEIRKFNIVDDGISLGLANYTAIADTDHFHRRDYNLIRQVYPNGTSGFTAFGGVFQKFADLPFLNPIDITSSSVQVNSSFNQNLNQYETAAMPVFDSVNNFMHTIFFGGMSMYTYDSVTYSLVVDSLVPFVNTISKVSRDGAGNLSEYSLPVRMPSLLGTNARFIPDAAVPVLHDKIILLNRLSGFTRAGYIVSGIQSDLPNVAALDPASMSRANSEVFEVYISKTPNFIPERLIKNTVNNLFVYPNPSHGVFNIEFTLGEKSNVDASVFNSTGKKIASLYEGVLQSGKRNFSWDGSSAGPGHYFFRISSGDTGKSVMMVVEK